MLGGWLLPGSAIAAEPLLPTCQVHSDEPVPLAQAAKRLAWECEGDSLSTGQATTWLLFEDWDRDQPPRQFTSSATSFARARIAAIDADGTARIREYTDVDATPVLASPIFWLPLPQATASTGAYVVAIDRPHSVTLANEAALVNDIADSVTPVAMVLVSLISGMLLMPLLFDMLFFVVLRERFVLLHGCMTVSGFLWAITSGGVITAIVELPVGVLAVLGQLSFAVGAGLMGFFIDAFLEPGALPSWLRRTLKLVSATVLGVTGLCALQLDFLRGLAGHVYYLAFIPLLPVYALVIGCAIWRRSRAALFVGAAWLPILLASSERGLRELEVYAGSTLLDQALLLALALEVTIIGMGVADRFLAVRRERDRAVTEARSLEEMADRDALTDLLNRRALESRYAALRAAGFTALAVIDLDHFKAINDRNGHAVGDIVLKCVANALKPGADAGMLAFRMGGEEFLLLLRGRDALERAEARRKAITAAVDESTPIGSRVTASMGFIDVDDGALAKTDLETLYERADQLLYQAKAAGRDRTISECLRVFFPRRRAA